MATEQSHESEMARSSACMPEYALDTADIVRDGCYQQLGERTHPKMKLD